MSDINYIKVWCEYDINGSFGGNNNEDIFTVSESVLDIEKVVLQYIMNCTGLSEEDLEGEWMYGWEFIEVEELV